MHYKFQCHKCYTIKVVVIKMFYCEIQRRFLVPGAHNNFLFKCDINKQGNCLDLKFC